MYKIEIDWDFRSPTLGVLTGQVRIGHIDMGGLTDKDSDPFTVKKERNTRGYDRCPAIFTRCKPLVDLMVDAYYDGMLMSNRSYHWFRDANSHNDNLIVTLPD